MTDAVFPMLSVAASMPMPCNANIPYCCCTPPSCPSSPSSSSCSGPWASFGVVGQHKQKVFLHRIRGSGYSPNKCYFSNRNSFCNLFLETQANMQWKRTDLFGILMMFSRLFSIHRRSLTGQDGCIRTSRPGFNSQRR